MLTLERKIEMLFSKNKNQVTIQHYEGLNGFRQDFPCGISFDGETITFTATKPELTATLKTSQIKSIDSLPERNFMEQYHQTGDLTAKAGMKWYWVIKYTSSTGEAKHVAFWDTGSKAKKLFDAVSESVAPSDVAL